MKMSISNFFLEYGDTARSKINDRIEGGLIEERLV